MSDRRFENFNYAPMRQGYDTNSWRTLRGAPAVVGGGRISVDNGTGIAGEAIHYIDFTKGDISFDVIIPTSPAAGNSRLFGLSSLNSNDFIVFSIDDALTCKVSSLYSSDESGELEWNDAWNGVSVEFRIRWEAGTAKFFINGSQVYAISEDSVPYGPLSLYLYDNSTSPMTFGDMRVRGAQSLYVNPVTSDSSVTRAVGTISISDLATITEATTMLIPELYITPVEAITISEYNNYFLPSLSVSKYEGITITENIGLSIV